MGPTYGRIVRALARGWRVREVYVVTGDTGARATIKIPFVRVGGYRVRLVIGWEALAKGQRAIGDFRFPS